MLDLKLISGVLAALITLIAYYPYVRDTLKGETAPHIYSWLVWSITLTTAAAGVVVGGGNYGSINLFVSAALTVVIALFAIKYGTKNITRFDTVSLGAALLAVVVWFQLDNPLLAIIMVIIIDGLGYLPTYRKTWQNPKSETPVVLANDCCCWTSHYFRQ